MALIELSGIERTFYLGESMVHALVGLDLPIAAGEYVSTAGPSDSGKSTLLNVLDLLDCLDEGVYQLEGCDVTTLSTDKQRWSRKINAGG